MKTIAHNLTKYFLFPLILASLACSFGNSIATELPATPQETLQDMDDLTGPRIGYNGIRFVLDPGLGSQLLAYDEEIASPSGQVAHYTRFALTAEEYCQTWCLMVYPVSEFEQAFGTFIFPPDGYGGGAAIVFSAQEKTLEFQNGSGERALQAFGQMSYFVGSEALKYVYRGMSSDGKIAVYLQVPVQADALFFPTPTLPVSGNVQEGISAHNRQLAKSLNGLDASAFKPDLTVLDELVSSIQIQVKE